MVLFIFVTTAALPRFFVLARVLVAGGASALVLDLVLAAGVVAFGAGCAAATLRCLRFSDSKLLCQCFALEVGMWVFQLILKVLIRFVIWQVQVTVLSTVSVVGLVLFLAPSELMG